MMFVLWIAGVILLTDGSHNMDKSVTPGGLIEAIVGGVYLLAAAIIAVKERDR